MEKPRLLSGEALVAKGITKIDASLPEVGLKDSTPNGSWLEQKQIQSALEARKYLIEVERIEKCGTLSHAQWRDDLMLAEVTQKSGGHWQYLGHNVGKTLYLRPEEALYLMEVNCLLLKHNDVTVSLQKAYSLLLHSTTTMIQYKVYASLSRLGYKVFKHKGPNIKNEQKGFNKNVNLENDSENKDSPVSMDVECDNVDSPVSLSIKTESAKSPAISTDHESDNLNPLVVGTLNDNIGLPIMGAKTDTFMKPDENQYPVTTVSDSEKVDTLFEPVIKPEATDSNVESKDPEKLISPQVAENENNVIVPTKEKETNKTDLTVNSAKDNESPIVMDIDKISELHSENETIGEVSSTVKENNTILENKVASLETCTHNVEAMDSGIAVMEEDQAANIEEVNNVKEDCPMDTGEQPGEDIVYSTSEESTAIVLQDCITTDAKEDTGDHNFADNTQSLKDLPKDSEPNIPNNSTTNDKFTQSDSRNRNNNLTYSYLSKIDKLTKRRLKPSDFKNIEKHFENVPDLFKKQVAAIHVSEQQLLPQNVFVNNSVYLLNLQNIKNRSVTSASTESASYTSSDEVNGINIRRIRSSSASDFSNNPNMFPQVRFPRHQHYRPYGFWRPQNNLNFYQFSMFFQRPAFPQMYMQSRVHYLQRPNPLLRSFPYSSNVNTNNSNISNARKRIKSGRTAHLQGIKNLAVRLKQCLVSGNNEMQNLQVLHNLLHSYNVKYKSRLRLTENFDVVNEEKIVETIELDDDEESRSKKPRLDQDEGKKFDENLYRLKQLALRLRDLESTNKATASHRRAFSKAIKTFNKSYNADVYLDDENYEVIDRRCITLESSSESDCVVEEQPPVRKGKGKKLRNPFNILKRRSERLKSINNPSTSKEDVADISIANKTDSAQDISNCDNKYSESILKTFNESWLPNENDFGRAEIVSKRFMNARLIDSNKELYLYDFMKDGFQHHQNWLEAKISFLRYLEETNVALQNEKARIQADTELCNAGLRPIIDSEDTSDIPSVLEKLRIIKSNTDVDTETSLRIDFDVYNRDVQNFRKRNPPKPHFRIICIDESSSFPSASHVMGLHAQYEDSVPIVFAIVGIGSVSYLQIKPIDLPIYIPSNDVV